MVAWLFVVAASVGQIPYCPPVKTIPVPPAPVDIRVSTRTETRDWRSDLAEAVKASVQYQGATDRAVAEYAAFGQALNLVLGGRGVVRGYDPFQGAIGGTPYAGNSIYGQRVDSVSTQADFIGQVDPNALAERYARAVEGLGPQQQQALSGLKETVDATRGLSQQAATQAARLEALRALPELIRSFMDPQQTIRTERITTSPFSQPAGIAAVSDPLTRLPYLAKYCASCHADGTRLNLDGRVPLTPEMAAKATVAVMWGKGLANATAAKKLVKQAMPPNTSTQITEADLPGVLADIGRLTGR